MDREIKPEEDDGRSRERNQRTVGREREKREEGTM